MYGSKPRHARVALPFCVLVFSISAGAAQPPGVNYPFPDLGQRFDGMTPAQQEKISEEIIQDAPAANRRDFSDDPEVRNYLREHKVYVSLTTSPLRIKHINKVLRNLDLTNVAEILINLPARFGRDNSKYKIPKNLKNNPRVRFLRTSVDYGPVTKMIPSVIYAKAKDPKSLVISIDDDIYYPIGMVNELIYQSVHNDFSVISSSGGDFPDGNLGWNLPRFPQRKEFDVEYARQRSGYVDLVEGYGAIAYLAESVDIAFVRALNNHTRACFFSDDLTISFALAIDNVPRRNVWNSYFNREMVIPLPHGLQADALHHGAGLLDGMPFENMADVNYEKYQRCYTSLIDLSYDVDSRSFRTKPEIWQRLKLNGASNEVIPTATTKQKHISVDILLEDLDIQK
jgi:hypothetical protein